MWNYIKRLCKLETLEEQRTKSIYKLANTSFRYQVAINRARVHNLEAGPRGGWDVQVYVVGDLKFPAGLYKRFTCPVSRVNGVPTQEKDMIVKSYPSKKPISKEHKKAFERAFIEGTNRAPMTDAEVRTAFKSVEAELISQK